MVFRFANVVFVLALFFLKGNFGYCDDPICEFSEPVIYDPLPTTFVEGIVAADLENDGDQDLVFSRSDNRIEVLLNDGTGTFAFGNQYLVGQFPNSLEAGDLNGDGLVDIAVTNSEQSDISILLSDGSGGFLPSVGLDAGGFAGPGSIQLGDLDADGDLDIVATTIAGSTVRLWLNNGDGTFVGQPPLSICCVRSLALSDFDNDGALDFVLTRGTTKQFSRADVYLNDGSANFQLLVSLNVGARPNSIVAADLDGDGDNDLAVAESARDTVSVILNNGDGTFAMPATFETSDDPNDIAASDVDGDQDIDLAVACTNSDTVEILLNNGNGDFELATPIHPASEPADVIIFDADGDLDMDIATANLFGSFNVAVNFNSCVLPGDVNLDGDVNLLDVATFVNLLGSGEFQAEADINQDGSVDLLDVGPFVELLAS